MHDVWGTVTLWLVLALIAALFFTWFRITTTLSEIIVDTAAQLLVVVFIGTTLGRRRHA